MNLAGRSTETAFNVMAALTGRAWDAVEDLQMSDLESTDGITTLLKRLDTVFKYDALTELPSDFENFFMHTRRGRNQNIQEYTADFERALRKLETHNVKLPDKVIGWFYLRRAGLKQDQRQMVMTTLSVDKLNLESVRKALNFVIGQDSLPDATNTYAMKSSRGKESIYYEDDYNLTYEYDQDYEDNFDDGYAVDDNGSYWDEDECDGEADEAFMAEENAAEYDEVFAAYVEARQRMNQMRLARGYYPVVAMVPGGQNTSKAQGKGKKSAKGSKAKGKNLSKQSPKPPSARARGKAALGSVKCLRCGMAGHYAKACPQSVKRKAEGPAEGDHQVNMVADDDNPDFVQQVNMYEDDGEESEPDDTGIWDCGAASVLVSRMQLKRYLRQLLMAGFDVHDIKAWTCTKGFRFGNGNKDKTNICVLLPTWFEGCRRDVLVYVITGKVQFLLGRPLMERLKVSIDYADKKIKWGDGPWKPAQLGPKGEYVLRLAEQVIPLLNEPVKETLVPADFYDHVQLETEYPIMQLIQENETEEIHAADIDEVDEGQQQGTSPTRAQTTPTETASPHSLMDLDELKDDVPPILVNSEGIAPIPFHTDGRAPVCDEPVRQVRRQQGASNAVRKWRSGELSMEEQVTALDLDTTSPEEAIAQTDESFSPTSDSHAPKKLKTTDGPQNLKRLTGNKLRSMMNNVQQKINEHEKILLACSRNEQAGRKIKIWEVFAGKGRLTQILREKYPGVSAQRFSLEEGWDFSKAKDRKAFIQKLQKEEPDSILLSPVCKLWSMMQELTLAQSAERRDELMRQREEDHDTILTFVAIVYEIQRRNGRDATVEHPWLARSWKTRAFSRMIGYDCYVDQCCYKLAMPDVDGVMKPVRKPTRFRTTGHIIYTMLYRECPGTHEHTPLEGYIPGVGHRTKLAENYPPKLAAKLAEALVSQVNHWEDVQAAENLEEAYNRCDGVGEGEDDSPPVSVTEPAQKNRELRRQVGNRPFEYVQRLHKNLGHVSNNTLCRMLEEVQATENVMTAAKNYVCPTCYARKRPAQAPPISGLKSTEFNERIQVDSHWILSEDTIVHPGTPAAKRKKHELTGRQCVLTIVDHATRYCAVRILKGETAEEFTKGIERMWFKHFGVPKYLRIDEAKGWTSKHVREWASSRAICLEVQPAEQHTWLGVVERKHQVIRRALELYQDELGRHDLSALKEAAIYVPHGINQTEMVKGFTPQQWVLGKSMTYVHGLTSEIFNPGQEPLDEAGAFSQIQQKRLRAQMAWLKADSDAKLRRAFHQKFQDVQDMLVVGQKCWYWRVAGTGILQKAKWRGPARIVAIEDHEGTRVLWLCHGTSLIRCGERQVRPLVEEAGSVQPADVKAALKDLEDLKARSTTQFRDVVQAKIEPTLEDNLEDNNPPDNVTDYEPSLGDSDDERQIREQALPGVVQMVLPIPLQNTAAERDRTPRRAQHGLADDAARPMSIASTAEPAGDLPPQQGDRPASARRKSPKRRSNEPTSQQEKIPRREETEQAARELEAAASTPAPKSDDDGLFVDVLVHEVVGELPDGWRCVDGCFELDDMLYTAFRKGEVNPRHLDLQGQQEFIEAKKLELTQYFNNLVWEFATKEEGIRAERNGRTITARWVLTWKSSEGTDGTTKWKGKARLVLRGFEDPDVLSLQKAAPTASRLSKTFLLTLVGWLGWTVLCGDVRAAFLSGKNFTRELVVKLPNDCAALLGVEAPCYMRMLKSAYGLSDAPLLWYQEADRRLQANGWLRHPLDKCCYVLTDSNNQDKVIACLVLHVDDVLIGGEAEHPEFKQAMNNLKKSFNFGKWDELSPTSPIKYCGGIIEFKDGVVQTSYEDYVNKICPMTLRKGRNPEEPLSDQERSKARGLIGALQWPAGQGMPALAASVSVQAGDLAGGDGKVLQELNKTLRFAKSIAHHKMSYLAKPETKNDKTLDSLAIVLYVDAAFSVRKDHGSQGGFVILAGDKKVLTGQKTPMSTLSWRSFKLSRVCRSSLAAECQALATGLEELLLVKNYLTHLQFPRLGLQEVQKRAADNCAVITDCKSLFDGIKRETIQQAADKRVALECLVIKELLNDTKCQWRWISSERQLADGLTKVSARQAFAERFQGQHVQLVADETFTAAKKKSKEERKRTLQGTVGTRSTTAATLVALVMESNVQIANGNHYQVDKVNTETDIETYSPINVELYGMLSKIFVLTILVVLLTMAHFHRDLLMNKFNRMRKQVRHIFVMKKIPQRKLENRIRDLEEEVENHKASLELQKAGFLQEINKIETERTRIEDAKDRRIEALEEQIGGYQEELAFHTDMIRNMQTAINQYTRERDNLRFRLTTIEAGRFDVLASKHGTHWHRNPECQFLRNSENLKTLTPCAGCT